ncbi:unnamed protein product [Amoebophrya sp. A120]|nr:unnamed protein product [Amoebophrya sp. A120]|eukprot:GSA120T00006418001.1
MKRNNSRPRTSSSQQVRARKPGAKSKAVPMPSMAPSRNVSKGGTQPKKSPGAKQAAYNDVEDPEEGGNELTSFVDSGTAKAPHTIGKNHSKIQINDDENDPDNSIKQPTDHAEKGGTTEEPEPPSKLAIIGCMFLNFWSAVGIIWVNKWVMNHGWTWTTLLTWMHFVASYIGLEISWRRLQLFEPKDTNLRQVVPLCASFIAFVVFNNLSLQYNTVGIYQLLKVLMTPVIVALQFCMHGTLLTFWQSVSLIPICCGVAMATISSLEVNGFLGLFFGAMGIFSTSLYQIWVKSKQADLQLNPFQLLHHQSFLSMLMLAPLAFYVDRSFLFCLQDFALAVQPDPVCHVKVIQPLSDPWFVSAVGCSCFLAYLVNLSTFLVIGKTSPVSYQVLGHSKLFVVMLSAFLMFGDLPSLQNLLGCGMALAGIFWYTWLKM